MYGLLVCFWLVGLDPAHGAEALARGDGVQALLDAIIAKYAGAKESEEKKD